MFSFKPKDISRCRVKILVFAEESAFIAHSIHYSSVLSVQHIMFLGQQEKGRVSYNQAADKVVNIVNPMSFTVFHYSCGHFH